MGLNDLMKNSGLDLQLILDSMQEVVFALDLEWQFTYINAAACKILGRDLSAILGTCIWVEIPEFLDCDLQFQCRTSMAEQLNTTYKEYCASLSKWFEVRLYPTQTGLYVFLQDIDLTKQMEEELETNRLVSEERENLLRESQERYQSLKRYNPDGICSLDLKGHVVRVNPALARLLGYSEEELKMMFFADLMSSEENVLVKDSLSAATRGEARERVECRLRRKNGSLLYVYCTHVPILVRGRVQGLYVILQDITQNKENEKLLRAAEARYRLISENSQDILSYSSPDGRLEYISPAVETLLGYRVEDIVGTRGSLFYHPEDLQIVGNIYLQVLQGQDTARFESRVQHKDGHYRWFETTLKAIRNAKGELMYMFGVGRDISDRKQAELRIQESEERYRVLVENSMDAIAVRDGDKWLYLNEAGLKMFGASDNSEIIGQPLRAFLHPDYHELLAARTYSLLHENKPAGRTEMKWYTLQQRIIETEVLAVPVIFRNTAAIQMIIRDISEQKQTERLVIQSEKLSAIGQLAAGVAHEIRNPLTSLKGFLKLLHSVCTRAKPEYFQVMEDELTRIELISSEMLVLAKPQATSFELRNPKDILQSVITLLETQAVMNNVRIITEYQDVSPILCTENAVKQVFLNLMKNAIEAMPNGGQLIIRLNEMEGAVFIQFEDQGLGIPQETLERLGEPFFTTKQSGTGLGLMVTRKILENHHGNFQVDSQIGVGTTVRVTFPVQRQLAM